MCNDRAVNLTDYPARRLGVAVGLMLVAFVLLLTGCGGTAGTAQSSAVGASSAAVTKPPPSSKATASAKASAKPSAAATSRLAPSAPTTDLDTIAIDQLPPEAVTTLQLIASDGPFPYSRDGVTFGNREGILPKEPNGFYAEYTVVTPGSKDRGARRIVAGDDGSRFYTDDHYASFEEVIQP